MGGTIPRQVDLGYIRIITEHEPGREQEPVKSVLYAFYCKLLLWVSALAPW